MQPICGKVRGLVAENFSQKFRRSWIEQRVLQTDGLSGVTRPAKT
jgi:hypothetical protein